LVPAVQVCKSRCTDGCFHGVLMQYFQDLNATDAELQPYFNLLCNSYNNLAVQIKKLHGTGDCYHSIGHAVMFNSQYQVPRAMKNCKAIHDKLGAYYCATGAYHEYFLMLISTDDFREPGNVTALYPCDTSNDFPAACYRTVFGYRASFYNYDAYHIGSICMSMSNHRQRNGCFHGYGLNFFTRVAEGHYTITDLCYISGDKTDRHMCVEGVAGAARMFYSTNVFRDICNQIIDDSILRKVCLQSGNEEMNKEPTFYYSIGSISTAESNVFTNTNTNTNTDTNTNNYADTNKNTDTNNTITNTKR